MSLPERGFLETVREDRLKMQPPPELKERTFGIISEHERNKRITERLMRSSLSHLEQSNLVSLLHAAGEEMEAIFIPGREFFSDKPEITVPDYQEAYSMTIPISEESALLTLLWDIAPYHDHGGYEMPFFEAKAIILESLPKGDIYVYGDLNWGSSHSTLKERKKDPSLEEKMLTKAYKTPLAVHYYVEEEEFRLVYHSNEHDHHEE